LVSQQLELLLVHWDGIYDDISACWLRWATLDGVLLPTQSERTEQERREKEQFRRESEQFRHESEQFRRESEQFRRENEQLVAKLRELGIDPSELN
jgi:predicted RNase H-like nuclease (RuvC/YqgF family)